MTFSELVRLSRLHGSIEDAIANAREAIALLLGHLADLGLRVPKSRRGAEIRIVAARRGRVAA